ncbi:MAG TPA: C4-dicarboxylate ABC transporter [Gammaproteobacteria bacterium]|jgi:tripartite ATP-independent transporter DctM subunit|nr:C4-dicarboxylate ABC transporter [Gammaproteobacteria bacterium]|tara:strand:+ start:4743 stop:6095 length:1353 start_codon:yes stop_codon:yes gene_type:complete
MPGNEILALFMFVAFIALVFTGFPVAWLLAGLAIFFTALAIVLEVDFGIPIGVDWNYSSIAVERVWNVMENWVMVALPMFIFMGLLLDRSGIANRLMTSFARIFGRVNGGLAITVTVIGVMLAATTGIIGASVVLLALLGLPTMLENGYDKKLAAGTVCAVGTLGILIPPSIMLVLMADRMAMSVGDLFLGAVFPGLLLSSLYIIYLLVYGAVRPELAPRIKNQMTFNLTDLVELAKAIVPPTLLIVAVLGSIFFGFATPTEAAGVGAAGALALAAVYGSLNLKVLKEVSRETTKTTAFIFGILIGATAFSLVLRGLGGDELIERALLGLPFGATGIVITILVLTFILGFFLDWIELTLIILPLVAPVVISLGFDPIWFTVLFAVCLQTSFLTPPVGFAIFYLKGVAPPGIDAFTIYRGVIPFILLQLIGLTAIFHWEALVTWLPAQAYS